MDRERKSVPDALGPIKMAMTTTEIRMTVETIEDMFPVETWVAEGVHLWPLIRSNLYLELFYRGRQEIRPSIRKNLLHEIFRHGIQFLARTANQERATLTDRTHESGPPAPVDALFLTYSVHRTRLREGWYDQYCEPFTDAFRELEWKSLILELSPSGEYRMPRRSPSRLIQKDVDLVLIKSKLRRSGNHTIALEGYDGFYSYLKENDLPSSGFRLEVIGGLAKYLLGLRDYFENILAITRPKIAFVAEYYSVYGSALIAACRRRGILSVDIQHGLTGDDHLAYGSFRKIPSGGYETLPGIFWCWSEYEAEVIRRWNREVSQTHRPFVGGNLWMNLWMDDTDELPTRYDRIIRNLKGGSIRSVHVLFTPSMLYDVKEWILSAMRSSPPGYRWWVRVHPCRQKEREIVRHMLAEKGVINAELDWTTEFPLLALLRHTDINVTSFSTTVHEAERFGVPSVLTDQAGVSLFLDNISSGTAVIATTPDALLVEIERLSRRKSHYCRDRHLPAISNVEILRKFVTDHLDPTSTTS